jgi:hypothetical protein
MSVEREGNIARVGSPRYVGGAGLTGGHLGRCGQRRVRAGRGGQCGQSFYWSFAWRYAFHYLGPDWLQKSWILCCFNEETSLIFIFRHSGEVNHGARLPASGYPKLLT